MIRLHTLAASTLLAALTLLPLSAPRADFSISFSTGSSHGYNKGHRDRGFNQRHRGYRDHPRGQRDRGHSRPHGSRIIIAPRIYGAPHFYGAPRRHALGSRCRPITERARDRFGRLVLLHRTLCYDRYGRPYVLGGP